MKNQLWIIFLAFSLSACSVCKVARHTPIQEIQFGQGGGFSGMVSTYKLRVDGTLWNQDKKITKLSCDSLDAIIELAEQLPKQNFVHPGNTYSFVRVLFPNETYYYAWSWGDLPDKKVTELYLKLNKQL